MMDNMTKNLAGGAPHEAAVVALQHVTGTTVHATQGSKVTTLLLLLWLRQHSPSALPTGHAQQTRHCPAE
jgi:hypothetical protein